MLAAFDLAHTLILLAIGGLAGVAGGLLGVGGGIVMIPALALLLGDAWGRDSFHAYNLASIMTAIVLSIPAAVRHSRERAVIYRMLPAVIPLALVGVVGGVLLAGQLTGEHTRTLKRIFGGFLEFVVLVSVIQEWRAIRGEPHLCNACPLPTRRTLIGLVVGLPSGIIAGLLGVGGGIWAVPAQSLLLGVRIRQAIATSTVMIIAIAIAASVGRSLDLARLENQPPLHHVAWWLALWLAPGALVGGWIGAGLTHRVPVRWLRYIFQALLAVTGVKLILS
jgi:uncharacterized membrane protein YfcA